MRQEFCLNHSSGLNAQNILSRILDQAHLTGGLPKPVFLAFLSVALICVSRARGERHVRRFFLSAYFGLQSTRPCGRDPRSGLPLQAAPYFNPRAPRGGRRAVDRISKRTAKFQSTRPRGGTTHLPCLFCSIVTISIHTPRMGARRAVARLRLHEPPISIHAPRMGARPKARPALRHRFAISIHTPRMGARLTHVVHGHGVPEISIHAPRVGARRRRRSCRTSRYLFQSTRPRGARRAVPLLI